MCLPVMSLNSLTDERKTKWLERNTKAALFGVESFAIKSGKFVSWLCHMA